MLAKHADDLLPTEIPDNVYAGLAASAVTDVHVFGRRGPAQVKFTPLELRELGELRDVDMVVYDEDFDYDEASKAAIASNKQVMVIDRVLQSWRKRPSVEQRRGDGIPSPAPALLRQAARGPHGRRRPRLRLPVGAHASGRRGRRRRHRRDPRAADPGALPRGRLLRLAAAGRALRRAPRRHPQPRGPGAARATRTSACPGVYATGWIKRGPVGLIGHTKSDAMETVRHIINDQGSWWQPADPSEEAIPALLAERGVRVDGPRAAGTGSTSTRSRSARRTSARASRSCRATRWSASRAASSRRPAHQAGQADRARVCDGAVTDPAAWVPDVLGARVRAARLLGRSARG